MAYRIFVTDSLYKSADLKFIPARSRWIETVRPDLFKAKRSGDEIAMEIITKAGLVVKK